MFEFEFEPGSEFDLKAGDRSTQGDPILDFQVKKGMWKRFLTRGSECEGYLSEIFETTTRLPPDDV